MKDLFLNCVLLLNSSTDFATEIHLCREKTELANALNKYTYILFRIEYSLWRSVLQYNLYPLPYRQDAHCTTSHYIESSSHGISCISCFDKMERTVGGSEL